MNTYWYAITLLIVGQLADLAIDVYIQRDRGIATRTWQQWLQRTVLIKVSTYLPIAIAVNQWGRTGAIIAGSQGLTFAALKYWQHRRNTKAAK